MEVRKKKSKEHTLVFDVSGTIRVLRKLGIEQAWSENQGFHFTMFKVLGLRRTSEYKVY